MESVRWLSRCENFIWWEQCTPKPGNATGRNDAPSQPPLAATATHLVRLARCTPDTATPSRNVRKRRERRHAAAAGCWLLFNAASPPLCCASQATTESQLRRHRQARAGNALPAKTCQRSPPRLAGGDQGGSLACTNVACLAAGPARPPAAKPSAAPPPAAPAPRQQQAAAPPRIPRSIAEVSAAAAKAARAVAAHVLVLTAPNSSPPRRWTTARSWASAQSCQRRAEHFPGGRGFQLLAHCMHAPCIAAALTLHAPLLHPRLTLPFSRNPRSRPAGPPGLPRPRIQAAPRGHLQPGPHTRDVSPGLRALASPGQGWRAGLRVAHACGLGHGMSSALGGL